MNHTDYTTIQEAFQLVNQLGAICATEGISEENKSLANKFLGQVLSTLEAPVKKFTAEAAGVITP
jgi:hypothetical protein